MRREQVIVPLLSSYKHGLVRKRVVDTISGGLKLRKSRYCWFNLFQLCLYLSPLVIAAPIIALDALGVWNSYYLATAYSIIHTAIIFSMRICVYVKSFSSSQHSESNDDFDDFEEEAVSIHCSLNSLLSIFSPKHIACIIIHCLLVSPALLFIALFILSPRVLNTHLSLPGAVVVGIIGWINTCSVLYSLTISQPHEVAVYRHTDLLGLAPIARPFYFILCATSIIAIRLVLGDSPAVDLIVNLMYTVLCLLSLGWTIGCLPPLDSLLPWIMELILTHFMGGSPMATDVRLLVMFLLSTVSTALVVIVRIYQSHTFVSLLLATITGYILSHDFFSCTLILSRQFCRHTNKILRWRKYVVHLAKASLSGCVLIVVSLLLVYFSSSAGKESKLVARTVIGASIIVLYLILFTSHMIQRVYIFGVIRNPLHPWRSDDTQRYETRRKWLSRCSFIPQLVTIYLAPLLMVVFLSLLNKSTHLQWLSAIGIARIYRKVWQNTQSALFELSVVALLSQSLSDSNLWVELGAGLQTLLVGLAIDFSQETLLKLWFGFALLLKFLLQDGKKLKGWVYIILSIASPLLLILLLVSALLSSFTSAPLLPLFTLPVFLVSYPRTRRFWPSLLNHGTSFNQCGDSIYYQHDTTQISEALQRVFSTGSASGQPGEYYILRCQDRTIIANVLEQGHCFHTLNLRGLEIEETSCHTVEASRIDDVFSEAYNNSSAKQLSFWLNCHPLSTMIPLDSVVVQTYSRSQISLTGVIDQPQGLLRFSENLLKCIVWVVHEYATCHHKEGPEEEKEENKDKKLTVKCKRNKVAPLALSESIAPTSTNVELQRNDSWSSIDSIGNDTHLNSRTSHNPMKTLIPVNIPLNHHKNISPPSHAHHCPKDESIPLEWQNFPLNINNFLSTFPTEWLDFICSCQPISLGMTLSSSLAFKKLCLTCHSIMDVPLSSHGISQTKPHHLYKAFCGEVPYSKNRDWLVKKQTLKGIILQAYRYAVKLMCDEAALGEAEDFAELYDYLHSYQTDYHIGREGDSGWDDAVLRRTPNIFSFGKSKDNDTYNALVLSLQDEVVHMGWLNPHAVRAVWSNLMVELLYLTNDDEERYSIQAHPSLLRNLVTQSADPPLGYPIFSSGLIRIPTLT